MPVLHWTLQYTFGYISLRKACMLAHGFCVSRKCWTGGGRWGHLQGDMHMVAARLGFERALYRVGHLPPWLHGSIGHTIACSLMSGHGQSQKSPCACHPHMHMVAARLALKGPWFVLGGPPPTMTAASTGLENTRGLVSGKKDCFGSEVMYDNWQCWLLHAR